MPLPTSINDLSTTVGSNSPAGSENPQTFDDYLRWHASFIAALRDVVLSGTANLTTANLTYTGTMTGSTGVLNIGSGQVYKDASGRLGLGATSLSKRLTLGNSSNATEQLRFATTAATVDFGLTASGIEFTTGNSQAFIWTNNAVERMRLDTSGNFGIGTSTTTKRVNIGNLSNTSEQIRFSTSLAVVDFGPTANGIEFTTGNNQAYIFTNNSLERMRVKETGQINLTGLASAPAGAAGDIYFDSVTLKHYGHNGTSWNALY